MFLIEDVIQIYNEDVLSLYPQLDVLKDVTFIGVLFYYAAVSYCLFDSQWRSFDNDKKSKLINSILKQKVLVFTLQGLSQISLPCCPPALDHHQALDQAQR